MRIPRPGDLLRLTMPLIVTDENDNEKTILAGSLVIVLSRALYDHKQGFQIELAAWDERHKEPVRGLTPFYLDEADDDDGTLAVRWP